MDGTCGSHGRRLALACTLALALLAPGGAGAATAAHGPLEGFAAVGHTVRPGISPIGAAGSGLLTYHGGPVMHTNRTYAIYWRPAGYTTSTSYRSLIDGYFQNVAADSGKTTNVYGTSAEYADSGGAAAYSSTFGGSVVDTQAFPASGCTNTNPATSLPFAVCLTDAQLTAEIGRVALAQGWPRNGSTQFFLFTPRNVGSCFDGSSTTCFAQSYCAYHSWSSDSNGLLVYANMPYAADTSDCGASFVGKPNGDDADLTINVASHEHMEAITDPLLNAWYDGSGDENGDKCAWSFGVSIGGGGSSAWNEAIGSGHYMLQMEWSNAAADCVQRPPALSAPANTVAPTVTGTAAVGQTLTLAHGTWTGSPTSYQYSWQRCAPSCTAISGAWSASYTLTSADAGATVKALVWALNAAGHGAAWTASTAAVSGPALPAATVAPSIGGAAVVGSTLTVSTGTWTGSPTAYQYSWQRCTTSCAAIPGAWSASYALTTADLGATVKVLVWALNAAGHGAAWTAPTAAVGAGNVPTNTVAPSIGGTAAVGQTLRVSPGTWTGSPTGYQYSWQRCTPSCTSVSGAWATSYTLTSADRGAAIRVLVWALNGAGHGAATTAPTAAVS